MRVYEHSSYEENKQKNVELNVQKLPHVSNLIDKYLPVADYIKKNIPWAKFGMCHGSRNAKEILVFRGEIPECEVFGTDISHTAADYPYTIEWDYHNVKEQWLDRFDFIYSNTLDHSHSPQYAIYQWIRCLNPEGLCFIEWDIDKEEVENAADCFGATCQEYREMFQNMGCLYGELEIKSPRIVFILHKIPINFNEIKWLNKFNA